MNVQNCQTSRLSTALLDMHTKVVRISIPVDGVMFSQGCSRNVVLLPPPVIPVMRAIIPALMKRKCELIHANKSVAAF